MTVKNGANYKSNCGRAAAYFIGTCQHRPEGPSRIAAYELITGLYNIIAEDAEKLGFKPVPDVYFRGEGQKGRENDVKAIRGMIDKIDKLVTELYDMAIYGESCPDGLSIPEDKRPKRTLVNILAEMGYKYNKGIFYLTPECAEGLRELALISRHHTDLLENGGNTKKAYLLFSRCVFEPAENWVAEAFDAMLDADGQLLLLCEELRKRKYTRINNNDCFKINLDYVKQHGKKNEPVKAAWADKFHSGIEVEYNNIEYEPCRLYLRLPLYASILKRSAELPKDVREFLCNNTKTCNGCRYCVQTDKTGTRPLAAMELDGAMKCPYYPAFSFKWFAVTPELTEMILKTLDVIESMDIQ